MKGHTLGLLCPNCISKSDSSLFYMEVC